jgi:predicted nucleic acid-binding protein
VTTYVDSSVLIAVYVPERFSDAARSVVGGLAQVPFTPLHRLEVSNALELLVGRRLITRAECRAVQAHVQDDLDNRRLLAVSLDLERIFAQASDLSRDHSARWLARSLDLLHVAAAHVGQCTTFVSADDRQLAVAKASGLAPIDIKRRRPTVGPPGRG